MNILITEVPNPYVRYFSIKSYLPKTIKSIHNVVNSSIENNELRIEVNNNFLWNEVEKQIFNIISLGENYTTSRVQINEHELQIKATNQYVELCENLNSLSEYLA